MNQEQSPRESGGERLAKFYRNLNAIGALALGSLAVLWPGPNPILAGVIGLNVVQAGVGELGRQFARNSRRKHQS